MEIRARFEELKRLVAADVRAQLGEPEIEGVAGELEDIDFLNASLAEREEMRGASGRGLARSRQAWRAAVNNSAEAASTADAPLNASKYLLTAQSAHRARRDRPYDGAIVVAGHGCFAHRAGVAARDRERTSAR